MSSNDPAELINAAEAAKYSGMTVQRINVLSRQNRLGRQVGGYWLYTRAELDAYNAQPKSKGGRPKSSAGLPLVEAQPA